MITRSRPPQPAFGFRAVRRGGKMLVRVDEPGQQELAAEIDLARTSKLRRRDRLVWNHGNDALAIRDHCHIRLRRLPRAVD